MANQNKVNKANKPSNQAKGGKPKNDKGNKHRKNNSLKGNKGRVNAVVVSVPVNIGPNSKKPISTQPDNTAVNFPPLGTQLMKSKKWCVKNVKIVRPLIEKWSFDTQSPIPALSDESTYILSANTIVNVLKPREGDPPSWSAVTYQKTLYDNAVKDWVTTKVTGWVEDIYLDNYTEHKNKRFQEPVVTINHQTKNSTDAQQYMTIEDEDFNEFKPRCNMCGELSIAFVANKDVDTVLNEWKIESPRIYARMVGKDRDEPLGRSEMEDILMVQRINFERYKEVIQQKGVSGFIVQKIPLAWRDEETRLTNPRRASADLQKKLKDFYLITNLKINTNTGDLTPASSADERNHWVVVDKITHDGARIELYNPFPNKFQEYSFGEFYQSVHGDPNSGWWIKRGDNQIKGGLSGKMGKSEVPEFKVHLDVPKRATDTAEQYVWIGGKKKTELCGEFCVAYIVGDSKEKALRRWNERKKMESVGLWELSTILKAFGYQSGSEKDFSIITLLEYWKQVQPKLHEYHVGGNKPTGTWELSTILKAYGYINAGDLTSYRTGLTDGTTKQFLPTPGRIKSKLKTHYLIAGVGIDNMSGKLISGGAVRHWVVLEDITPLGSLIGGNGGWVELYNPFPNIMEEYSLKEFAASMNENTDLWGGDGLWVKRDVQLKFKEQAIADPRPEVKLIINNKKGGKQGGKNRGKQGGKQGGKNRGKQSGKHGGKNSKAGEKKSVNKAGGKKNAKGGGKK